MATLTIDTSKATSIGDGLKAILVDDTLILLVDTKNSIGPSKSGKMEGVASTGGFTKVPAGLKANVYVGK